MIGDARINTGLPTHPKTKKLIRRLGQAAAWNLVCLYLWAAQNRPDGDLSGMSDEDIELAADWQGEHGRFVLDLADLRFLDGDPGSYHIHDWADHNPWAAGAEARSEKSRWAALCKQYGRKEAARMMPEYAERVHGTTDDGARGSESGATGNENNSSGTKEYGSGSAKRGRITARGTPKSASVLPPALPESASGTQKHDLGSAPSPSPSPSPSPKALTPRSAHNAAEETSRARALGAQPEPSSPGTDPPEHPPDHAGQKPPATPERPSPEQRLAVQAAIVLRNRGFRVTYHHPDLVAAEQEAVPLSAIEEMADLYPDKPAGYVIAAARRQHAESARPIPAGGTHAAHPAAARGQRARKLSAVEEVREANRRAFERLDAGAPDWSDPELDDSEPDPGAPAIRIIDAEPRRTA